MFGGPDFTRRPEGTEDQFDRRIGRVPLHRVDSRISADAVIDNELAFLVAFCTEHGVAGDRRSGPAGLKQEWPTPCRWGSDIVRVGCQIPEPPTETSLDLGVPATMSERKVLSVEIVDAEGGATTVRLSGELDLATAPELDDCLLSLAGTNVVVDVSGLTFMDSSGVNSLIAAHKRAVAARCSLVLRGVAGAVARTLQLTGVDQVLTVEAAD